jgi:hypothetical protein
LVVEIGVLVIATLGLAYNYLVAKPGAEAAEKKIQDYVDAQNKKGVRDAKPVTSKEISELLGMKPTYVEKHDDENYEIEYYCWWGPVPVLNMRKEFISVVYYGTGEQPRRFSSHHRNEKPPEEALPIPQQPASGGDAETLSDPESAGAEAKAAEAPAAASGEEGKGISEPPPAKSDAPAAKDAEPAKDS